MKTNPLSSYLGAEVRGVDLESMDDALFQQVHSAFLEYQLLVFRDQDLSPEGQLSFSRRLGPLDIHILSQYNHPDYPEIFVLSNEIKDGKPFGIADGGSYWHSDFAFREQPALATILNSKVIPAEGGNTLFVNMVQTYDDLDDVLKQRLSGLRAIHRYRKKTTSADQGTHVEMNTSQLAATPDVAHPVVRTHPDTGRKALFVHPGMTAEVEGLDAADSDALLQQLFDHCTQEKYQYALKWSPGDVVMWDNRCVMHKATTRNLAAQHARTLFRTTVMGEKPV